VAVVERVHEVETDVPRNQLEARRTAPGDFRWFLGLGQRGFSLPTYYLTTKTLLTS
jgi:hypothetical protein